MLDARRRAVRRRDRVGARIGKGNVRYIGHSADEAEATVKNLLEG